MYMLSDEEGFLRRFSDFFRERIRMMYHRNDSSECEYLICIYRKKYQ